MATPALLDEDISFTSIAEAFVQSMRDGETPSVAALCERYPRWAKEIEEEIPTLILAEQLSLNLGNLGVSRHSSLPKKIKQYRITGELGQGGMGCVYSAIDELNGEEVAIKVMSLVGEKKKNGLKRFRREANSAGRLKHPNIIPILDYIDDEDINCIVMPKIDGVDLANVMERIQTDIPESKTSSQAVSFESVASIGLQVASALAYAHEQGLVHRDIKPGNLLLEASGHLWVMDFGLVKTREIDKSLSRTGDLIGTPRYMAPEQLRGICDRRSDIYGLGITLYELVTGRKAWGRLRGRALLTRPQGAELVPIRDVNDSVPVALAEIITKCCALDPDDRYQTAQELHYVLERFVLGYQNADRRKTPNLLRYKMKRRLILNVCLLAIAGCALVLTAGTLTPKNNELFIQKVMKVFHLTR